jgi:hypothetical protein
MGEGGRCGSEYLGIRNGKSVVYVTSKKSLLSTEVKLKAEIMYLTVHNNNNNNNGGMG